SPPTSPLFPYTTLFRSCRFPNPAGFGPEYSAWRNALKRRMEREGISGYKHSTPAQWAAIQAYALTVEPIASNGMAAHWEANTNRSEEHTSELQSPCNLV